MTTEVTFSVGQRVAHTDGSRATIRYIGPVATSKNAATIYIGAGSGQLATATMHLLAGFARTCPGPAVLWLQAWSGTTRRAARATAPS